MAVLLRCVESEQRVGGSAKNGARASQFGDRLFYTVGGTGAQ
jgi:hypothetical protein